MHLVSEHHFNGTTGVTQQTHVLSWVAHWVLGQLGCSDGIVDLDWLSGDFDLLFCVYTYVSECMCVCGSGVSRHESSALVVEVDVCAH